MRRPLPLLAYRGRPQGPVLLAWPVHHHVQYILHHAVELALLLRVKYRPKIAKMVKRGRIQFALVDKYPLFQLFYYSRVGLGVFQVIKKRISLHPLLLGNVAR
jgi:hypothetical protein